MAPISLNRSACTLNSPSKSFDRHICPPQQNLDELAQQIGTLLTHLEAQQRLHKLRTAVRRIHTGLAHLCVSTGCVEHQGNQTAYDPVYFCGSSSPRRLVKHSQESVSIFVYHTTPRSNHGSRHASPSGAADTAPRVVSKATGGRKQRRKQQQRRQL